MTIFRKRFFKFFFLTAFLMSVLILSAVLLLKSPYFPELVERIINSSIDKRIEIGSLIFEGNKVVIKDMKIEERDKDELFLILPEVEAAVSLSGILHSSINRIAIKKPQLFINLWEPRKPFKIPGFVRHVSVKQLTIENGGAVIQTDPDKAFHISSISLSVEEAPGKKAKIKGSAFLHEFNSTVPLEAVLDMERFDIERGRLDIAIKELENFTLKDMAFLKDKNIRGSLSLSADIYREQGLEIKIDGDFQGLAVNRKNEAPFIENASGKFYTRFQLSDDSQVADVLSEVTLHNLQFHSKQFGINLKSRPLKLNAKGSYYRNEDALKSVSVQVQISNLKPWDLLGSLQKVSSGNPEIALNAEGKEIDLNVMKELLTGAAVKPLSGLAIDGYGGAEFSVTGHLKTPRIHGSMHVLCRNLKKDAHEFRTFEITVPLEYRGGSFIVRKALIHAKDFTSSATGREKGFYFRVNDIGVSLPYLEYKNSTVTSGDFHITADEAVVYRDGKRFHREGKVSLKGVIQGSVDKGLLQIKNVSLKSATIKNIEGDISVHAGRPIAITAEVRYRDIDLNRLLTEFPDIFHETPVTVGGTGIFHSVFTVTVHEGRGAQIAGKADLDIVKGSFSSSDATKVGEGIHMNVSSDYTFSLPLREAAFTISAEASDFELLIGRFYGNFKDKKINLSLDGRYTGEDDTIQVSRSTLSLADVATILISGHITHPAEEPHFHGEVQLVSLSNRKAYDFFVRDTFKESFPVLSDLHIEGATSMMLAVEGTKKNFHASGSLHVTDTDIIGESRDFSMQGISISMPVDVWYPEIPFSQDIERFGSLKVHAVSWKDIHLRDIEAFPVIWRNALAFRDDIGIPVFAGNIRLSSINYENIFSSKGKLVLSIYMDGIELGKVSEALKIPRFSGVISGVIPRASFVGSRLAAEGEIVMELFGGEMRLSNLSINNIFSSISSLKTSIEIKGIDLGRLTNTFEVGHISGVMQGSIHNLVITNGQPGSFEAVIETVSRKGVRQWISVEALRKISILGSGAPASILNTGIYQLFKRYRYKKMGFRGSLRNDTFHLLGVESEGNKEYLVKGGFLPPRVDVINYTHEVSFQEMLKRLNRIKLMEQKKK